MQTSEKLALGSIAVGIVVLLLKLAAYGLTGSIALYSDAVESIINVAASAVALIAIRLSLKPADANHPYGHHKAEYFSVVLEGVLIVLAALSILREAYAAFVVPPPLTWSVEGVGLNALASLLNGVWSAVLVRRGRALMSPALIADGQHLWSDVLSSIGVLAGVMLAILTGWAFLDPLLAALVAVNIVWSGWGLIRQSISGLMDEALPLEQRERIGALIASGGTGALQAHDLRTRRAGRATFIDFHLVVPGSMSVHEAHEVCDRIERSLRGEVGDAIISIHVEPEGKAKHGGILVR